MHWQVKGKWHIELTSLGHTQTNCGYNSPDQNVFNLEQYNYNFETAEEHHIDLTAPNEVHKNGHSIGDWTMVYDEGVEMSFDSGDSKRTTFFAFMHYEPRPHLSYMSENVADYVSHCDQTRVGWVTRANHDGSGVMYGCGKAIQTRREEEAESLIASLPSSHNLHHKKKSNSRHLGFVTVTSHLKDDELYQPDFSLVETINNDHTSLWKATVHKQFKGKTMKEMYALLGRNRFNSIGAASKIRSQKVKVDPAPISMLDLNMSMNQESSINWVTSGVVNPVRNQHSCGSCYAMAATDAFSSRYQVHTKKKIMISPQDVLSCSQQNQGCEGGYPFLVAKFGKEIGFLQEHCLTYAAHDSIQCSSEHCSNNERVQLSTYGYVGGYYGACNEVRMIEALKDGPIIVAFDAKRDLFHYSSGLYHCNSHPESEQQKGENVPEWEQTTHAVVCVGYGTASNGVKYWLIKNSWGSDWGESGYFRIVRGENTCGIESMAVYGTF